MNAYAGVRDDEKIQSALSKIKDPKHREVVWQEAKKLAAEKEWTPGDYSDIITVMAPIPVERLPKVSEATLNLSQKDWTAFGYSIVIAELGGIPPHLFEPVLSARAKFQLEAPPRERYGARDEDYVFEQLSCLGEDSEEKLRVASNLAASICHRHSLNIFKLGELLSALKIVPLNRMDSVLGAVEIIAAKEYGSIIIALTKLGDISEERLIAISRETAKLTAGKHLNKYIYGYIIKYLDSIPENRLEATNKALVILTEGKDLNDFFLGHMIKALSEIPLERLEEISQAAAIFDFPKEELTESPLKNILPLFSQMPRDRLSFLCRGGELEALKPLSTHPKVLESVIHLQSLLPEENVRVFLQRAIESFHQNVNKIHYWNLPRWNRLFGKIFLKIIESEIEDRQRLWDYWIDIVTGENKWLASFASVFIAVQVDDLLLYEDHPVVQWALRVLTVLNENDETSPYVIYDRMKAKRDVPIDWDSLPCIQGEVGGLFRRLNLKGISRFGVRTNLDLTSVPTINQVQFVSLLNDLETALKNDSPLAEDTDRIFARSKVKLTDLLDAAQSPSSHFILLMKGHPNNIAASQLKCVVRWFSDMEASPQKWLKLVLFLAGVRNCSIGKDTAIQDWYMGLPSPYRLKAKEGSFDVSQDEIPLFSALYHAIETVVSSQFSPESHFMKTLCGEEDIKEAGHQINWARRFMGDKVGLQEGPKFDIHINTIYQSILDMPLQEMLHKYYEGMTLSGIIPLVQTAFNRNLVEDPAVYTSLARLHTTLKEKDPTLEDIDTWVELDQKWKPKAITPKGLVRVLTRAGLLDELRESPLAP